MKQIYLSLLGAMMAMTATAQNQKLSSYTVDPTTDEKTWSYKATYENFYDADGNLEKRNVYDSGEWTSIQYYTWGERTAIQSVKDSAASSAPWFDLNGRRLDNQPTKKGLFIRNGKKVLIK